MPAFSNCRSPPPLTHTHTSQHLLRVLSCDHRELRDGSGTINKTNAMKIFTLADKDLKGVPFEPVKLNPKWRCGRTSDGFRRRGDK